MASVSSAAAREMRDADAAARAAVVLDAARDEVAPSRVVLTAVRAVAVPVVLVVAPARDGVVALRPRVVVDVVVAGVRATVRAGTAVRV